MLYSSTYVVWKQFALTGDGRCLHSFTPCGHCAFVVTACHSCILAHSRMLFLEELCNTLHSFTYLNFIDYPLLHTHRVALSHPFTLTPTLIHSFTLIHTRTQASFRRATSSLSTTAASTERTTRRRRRRPATRAASLSTSTAWVAPTTTQTLFSSRDGRDEGGRTDG